LAAFTHDVIIIGHGLAGALLCHELIGRGLKVHVFDQPLPGNASGAAAGLINPIALRRDVLTWRALELLPLAQRIYQQMEQALGVRIWHSTELIKIFPTAAEAGQWARAMQRKETAGMLALKEQPALEAGKIPAPHGHGTVLQSAWVDIRQLLHAQRKMLLRNGSFSEQIVAAKAPLDIPEGVMVGDISAPLMVHCNGAHMDLPGLVPVKGEVLTCRIPGLHLDRVVHRGVFLLPLGEGSYRVGSTYEWDNVWTGPGQPAREYLLERLRIILPHQDVEVVAHQAGVRPTSRDRRPQLGWLRPHHAVFNGLGSRGALLAPWCAGLLVDHLLGGKALDAEVDIRRFQGR
jgi:glycine oxidase